MDVTGDTSANQDIDGAFWNAVQIRPLLLTVPKIVLLWRTSAACQQEQDEPPHLPFLGGAAVLALALNAAAVGAPGAPTLRIRSPLPLAMRSCLA